MLDHEKSEIKQTVFCLKMVPGYGQERHTIKMCTRYRCSTEEGGIKSKQGQDMLPGRSDVLFGFPGVYKDSVGRCLMWGKGHFRKKEQYIQ